MILYNFRIVDTFFFFLFHPIKQYKNLPKINLKFKASIYSRKKMLVRRSRRDMNLSKGSKQITGGVCLVLWYIILYSHNTVESVCNKYFIQIFILNLHREFINLNFYLKLNVLLKLSGNEIIYLPYSSTSLIIIIIKRAFVIWTRLRSILTCSLFPMGGETKVIIYVMKHFCTN